MKTALIVVVAVALSAPASAQWLKQPTAGLPRTPDGKPNLTAPAPRAPDGQPDLSGLWMKISPKLLPEYCGRSEAGRGSTLGARARGRAPRKSRQGLHEREVCAARTRLHDRGRQHRCRDDEDRPDPGPHHHPQSRSHLSTDLSRRPQAGNRAQSHVDGILGRTLGGRDAGRGELRVQRSDLARSRWPSTHRSAACDRTLPPSQRRQPRYRGDVLRSRRMRGPGPRPCGPSLRQTPR